VRLAIFALLALAGLAGPASAQVGGNLAALPAVELRLDITTSADGRPVLSQSEFRITTGDYYRMNVKSDGKAVWRMEAPALLENSHLRIVTIAGIEVQLQSMVFRAIEFDAAGEAKFTFTPIRPGTYEMTISNDPRSVGRPIGAEGVSANAKTAVAKFIVQ
jgi:hypothetical protein